MRAPSSEQWHPAVVQERAVLAGTSLPRVPDSATEHAAPALRAPSRRTRLQGMKRATVGLTLADGTLVPLLTGKNEREVRCEGPWSTSSEGLPDWARMFSNERFFGPCYPVSCPAWVWKPQNIVVRAWCRPRGFEGSVRQYRGRVLLEERAEPLSRSVAPSPHNCRGLQFSK